ncbi:nucleotide sugar dehydrogenase [Bradymonas sediminis]|uniref:UDP-N-acetyl-D-glucosamine dehydrogenase n=1 Tax=Bradymonas sediminis TaxID=1548548 RepID=A0A2Z4FG96_9DELT|nr:nucleotide sugar dehydrogenase [Bradymonas sediminis]AWV87947.1 UDP-N-acetyl-D-glucosamine dehydrogenase [Bradymonas sediminis]TDP62967.1 UDP-N-acetyl-D-glucosamine dehydrogenase [Bradymonas sediminis]
MSSSFESLRKSFEDHTATVAVIGQGYVGLPLALRFVAEGFRCIGIDINPQRVQQLSEGISHITDVSNDELREALDSGLYEPSFDFAHIAEADAVSICVPTPLNKTREPDLSYIRAAAESVAPYLKSGCLVVLESTTYPGTTNEVLTPMLILGDHELDDDIFVAFSPERVDPGNLKYKIGNTPKVVGGVTEMSGVLAKTLYDQVIDEVYPVTSATGAELVKLLENTFRAVNIALVNEMAIMCDRMDIDIWSVIDAASTKPFGFMPFYPGPGIGGHCIPLDPSYLSWKAKSFGFYNRFIESATDINTNMPRFVVNKLARILNDEGKALRDANIILLGMSYKPDVSDTRESPALDIWKHLTDWKANLSFHDPVVEYVEELDNQRSVALTPEVLAAADAVVVVTNHSAIDWEMVIEHAPLIFDTRNAIQSRASHIHKL